MTNSELYSAEINDGKTVLGKTFTGYSKSLDLPDWLDETTTWAWSNGNSGGFKVIYLNSDKPCFITCSGKIVTLDDLVSKTSLSGNIIVEGTTTEEKSDGETFYKYTLKAYTRSNSSNAKTLFEISKKTDGLHLTQHYTNF